MSSVAPGGIAWVPGGMFVPFAEMRRPREDTDQDTQEKVIQLPWKTARHGARILQLHSWLFY